MAETAEKKSIYLFSGEDSFSAFEKAQLWKAKFLEKYGDLNCLSYYGEDLTSSEFQTAIESYPFLSEKKLVMVQDFLAQGSADEQKAVAEMLDLVPDYCVVVFFEHEKPDARTALFKKLGKLAQVENFEPKTGAILTRWIRERAAKKVLALGEREAVLMAELVGPNLWNLANEIDKLALYAGGRPVDTAMVEKVVSINLASSIFKLTDFLGDKRLKEAMRTLEILVNSGEEVVGMLFMLVRHFRIMAQVKDLAEKGERAADIAKKIKEHPFVVSKVFTQCRGFSAEQIRQIYQMLADIDSGFKTGRIKTSTTDNSELVRELEVLVGRVCLEK
jgi:DNA polymerase-3 subunit delta